MFRNKVIQNAKWIIVCKVAQAFVQMIIGMITARYLGPSNYGLISYAASVVAFAVPIMQLGMRSTLVQEYVSRSDQEGVVVGTSLALNIFASLICMVGVVSFAAVANSGENETVVVCALYSTSLFFQAAEMLQYWFQAKLLSKYSSLALLGAYLTASVYKIYLLISGKEVYWFALSHAVEYAVASVLLLLIYKKVGGQEPSVSIHLAIEMLAKSKYYILANLMVTIFQNTDHIMLKLIAGDEPNGFYTTAVTCSGVTSFVYSAILDTGRPVILEKHRESAAAFEKNISRLYAVLVYMTVVQCICFVVLAKPIIYILYGNDYLPAVTVLRVLVWQLPFSYMGAVRNIWILCEEKHSLLWIINLSGALANIFLNAIMIPIWGACGAAFASVLTQFVTNFVVGFLLKEICPNNRLLLKGLNPKLLVEMIRDLKNMQKN